MTSLGIIPARYASTRLPGKPLADIGGKPMIQRVYEAAKSGVDWLIVATDSEEIASIVKSFGGEVIRTGSHHINGTSRCAEALQTWTNNTGKTPDVVVNIQGDEPLLKATAIEKLVDLFRRNEVELATLVQVISKNETPKEGSDVYVVCDKHQKALYFSRSVIPFVRDENKEAWSSVHHYLKHIGMYAFRPKTLLEISAWEEGKLERAEKLEQLRWLENGQSIYVAETDYECISVDTPEDLEKVRRLNWD